LPRCLRQRGRSCDAFMIDLDADTRPEVIVVDSADGTNAILRQGREGWEFVGSSLSLVTCRPLVQAMREGKMRALAPRIADLEIAGQRVEIRGDAGMDCPEE